MEALILTGACAVGKTTIARALAKAKEGAIVECDYFTESRMLERVEVVNKELQAYEWPADLHRLDTVC